MLRPSPCMRLERCYAFLQKVGRDREIQTPVTRAEMKTCMFTPSLQKACLCCYNLPRKPVLALQAGVQRIMFENKPTCR